LRAPVETARASAAAANADAPSAAYPSTISRQSMPIRGTISSMIGRPAAR
jgi:hypothetical protein